MVRALKVKSICIGVFKKAKLKYIIVCSILIAIILMIISCFFVFNNRYYKKKYEKFDIFNANSYFAKYNMRVFSNKNQNEYKINEWYSQDGKDYKFKFETINEEGLNYIYEGDSKSINIYSADQLNKISLNDTIIQKENLISISTFADILKKVKQKLENNDYETKKCCKLEENEEDGKVSYKIIFNNSSSEKCSICKFVKDGINISSLELIINSSTFFPIEYIIYGKNGDALYDILYEKFEVNVDFK